MGVTITAGAAAAILFTAAAYDKQQEAIQAQRKAVQKRQDIARVQNFRRRQQQVRQERAARARAISQGVASGAAIEGTSAVGGTTSSIRSEAASNISFLDRTSRLQQEAASLTGQANKASGQASLFSDIAGSSGQIATIFKEVDTGSQNG